MKFSWLSLSCSVAYTNIEATLPALVCSRARVLASLHVCDLPTPDDFPMGGSQLSAHRGTIQHQSDVPFHTNLIMQLLMKQTYMCCTLIGQTLCTVGMICRGT